jgi:hypothetical protein
MSTGAFDAELYDRNKEPIEDATPVDVLKRGSEITAILDCTGVWITEKGFGLTWKLYQARVDVAAEGMQRGCAIQDDEEDSAPVVATKTVAPKVVAKPAAPAAPSTDIGDEDEADLMAAVKPTAAVPAAPDVDEDEVHEAPPVPAPKKIIKKIVKKTA